MELANPFFANSFRVDAPTYGGFNKNTIGLFSNKASFNPFGSLSSYTPDKLSLPAIVSFKKSN